MRRSEILEERRRRVSPEARESVAMSFRIADRIHDILEEKGLKQKSVSGCVVLTTLRLIPWLLSRMLLMRQLLKSFMHLRFMNQ